MAKKLKGDQVLTGQLLREGDVVYLTESGAWSLNLQDAKIATTPDEVEAFDHSISTAEEENLVIDIYPFVVLHDEAGLITPSHIREKVRTKGPSIKYVEA